ncbi:MAG TPA: SoxR reducing system RseC family protein [Woeseiaceae bacterium]|jgi:sigma-E factor negative regulatory protein RseC|nr:SoxR reducing system RseC family protein [Woeseiaceae bacterium]
MEMPEGRIIELHDNADPPRAVVEVESSLRCARCAAGKGCGAGLLGGETRVRRVDATIRDSLEVGAGDRVQIALDPAELLQGAFVAYGIPLLAIVVAAALAWFAGWSELATVAAALGAMATGIAAARAYLGRRRCLHGFTPVVVARLGSD